MDLAIKLGAFLAAILVLVTIHEYGHFWVARKLGVKVLRFSIGFGRPLLTWRPKSDDTEYMLAAIPLGGYVKMLDEREEEVEPAQRHLAFNNQKLWKRSAIVAAGPLANFLFAILVYWGILVAGESGIRPEVGTVAPESIAAEAEFRPGDMVQSVDGRETPTWGGFWFALLSASLDGDDVPVAVRTADGDSALRIVSGERLAALDPGRGFLGEVGLRSASPVVPPVIGQIVDGEPAAAAGLREGDRIIAIDGKPIEEWSSLVEAVQAHPGETLSFSLERGAEDLELAVTPASLMGDQDQAVGRIGAGPAVPDALFEPYRITVVYGPLEALGESLYRVGDLSVLTLRIIGRMLIGAASVENLSSPIGIADTAGKTASFGVEPFVKFLALLSISLGLLNLLPIPVLDGGHLLYFAIEGVTGKPLSEAAQAFGQRIGLAMILSLMTLAFYVDIARMLG
ncbi:MAG: RIP metalloprotease RseP [Thiohalocapsa sp.]|nr:RIP metalloprotease RseP [Thiohalocapsa sp.]